MSGRVAAARVVVSCCLFLGVWCGVGAACALGAGGTPWWRVESSIRPSVVAPGGEGTVTVKAVNVGDASATGPVVLRDVLPPGLSVVEVPDEEEVLVPQVGFFDFAAQQGGINLGLESFVGRLFKLCEVVGRSVSCTPPAGELAEEFKVGPVAPFEDLEIRIKVKAEGVVSGAMNIGEVSGGGAATAKVARPVVVGSGAPVFGVEDLSLTPEEEGGGVDVQAGSHPFQLTATLGLNQTGDPANPPALAKDLRFRLPAGLIGNATALPQCSDLDFRDLIGGAGTANKCGDNTVVGVAVVTVDEPATLGLTTLPVPLFNLVPGQGEPARFGFEFAGTPVTLDTAVRAGSDYGVTVSVNNITQLTSFLTSMVTFWGVPGDARHDPSRGWGCLANRHWGEAGGLPCTALSQSNPPPFLTMPTSCVTPFTTSVEGESWPRKASPGALAEAVALAGASATLKDEFGRELGVAGCNQLPFAPTIEVQPDVQSGSTPTGLAVHVRVPQEVSQNPDGLSSSAVKDTTVTLPEGVTVSPSSANGLEACSEGEIGFVGIDGSGTEIFTPGVGSPFCPAGSKIGTVKFKIPVIANPLEGAVYLAAQNQNPFGSLVAMYIVAEDPVSGVLVKLAGEVQLSETGQVVTTLRNSPQAPLEEAEFHFFGGDRAPLSTPAACGRYETHASFTPWSGNPSVPATSTFEITSGPHGVPCSPSLPFNPTLAAGTTNIQAGAFTPLVTTISREDGNQDIQGVQLRMPPGLSGMITNVAPCAEAQANAGTCGAGSLIGHTIVSVGLGGTPYSVTGGQVFLTGPYRGAPFGLSIVNPAKAGPFDLGKVIVRAKLEIDPVTAQAVITTDPSGPYAIPHILDGIPLQIKHVNVTIDREGFTFNPTNCSPLAVTGSVQSTQGASAAVSTPFQITNCAVLKFTPKFTVTTTGRTSKQNGASLTARLVYPKTPQGTETNIAKVKVSLPKALPSRLTTLQKACIAKTFETNPASCSPGSIIGHATVHTPLLPVPLTGPVYFVSHGGEAFPSLTIVLQGDNVKVQLVGSTLIRNGITSTTFKSTPDVPFNSFEITLPQGKNSALAANGNLCKTKLTMPAEFTAQNGSQIKQNTKITVTNCHKAKHRKRR